MLVDYEAAWLALMARLGEKPNWGRDQIRAEMAAIVSEHHVPESGPEEALRLYGVQFHEDLRAAARDERVIEPADTGHEGPNHGGRSSSVAMASLPGDQSHDDPGGRHDGRSAAVHPRRTRGQGQAAA